MTKRELLEGLHRIDSLLLDKAVALAFKFDSQEQALAFHEYLQTSIQGGYLEFDLTLDSRDTVQ